MALQIISYNCK